MLILLIMLLVYILINNVQTENFGLCEENTVISNICKKQNLSDEREEQRCQAEWIVNKKKTCDGDDLEKEEEEEIEYVNNEGVCVFTNDKEEEDCACGDDGISKSCCDKCKSNMRGVSDEKAHSVCVQFGRCAQKKEINAEKSEQQKKDDELIRIEKEAIAAKNKKNKKD